MMLPSSRPIRTSSLPSGRRYMSRALSITTGIGRAAVAGTPRYPVSWRHTVTGTSRPTIAATRAAQGPAALTTIGAAIRALRRVHPGDPRAVLADVDRRDLRALDEPRAARLGRAHEPGRRDRRIRVARRRLVGRDLVAVEGERGGEARDVVGLDRGRVDPDRPVRLDVRAHPRLAVAPLDPQEPGVR